MASAFVVTSKIFILSSVEIASEANLKWYMARMVEIVLARLSQISASSKASAPYFTITPTTTNRGTKNTYYQTKIFILRRKFSALYAASTSI